MRFVLDGHLGRLASYLRLLGFDTIYRRDGDDDALARLLAEEGRILLSCDRGLLKRRQVSHGYLPRSEAPLEQLLEVVEAVEKASAEELLPPHTQRIYSTFYRCRQCGQIYWKGAHSRRIQALIDAVRKPDTAAALHGVERPDTADFSG